MEVASHSVWQRIDALLTALLPSFLRPTRRRCTAASLSTWTIQTRPSRYCHGFQGKDSMKMHMVARNRRRRGEGGEDLFQQKHIGSHLAICATTKSASVKLLEPGAGGGRSAYEQSLIRLRFWIWTRNVHKAFCTAIGAASQ